MNIRQFVICAAVASTALLFSSSQILISGFTIRPPNQPPDALSNASGHYLRRLGIIRRMPRTIRSTPQ